MFNSTSHRLGLVIAVLFVIAVGTWFYLDREDTASSFGNGERTSVEETAQPVMRKAQGEIPEDEKNTIGAVFKTSLGEIEVALFNDKAPKTVENFETLVKAGFYDGTKFHRVIKDFMIQGGDPFSRDDTQMERWGTGGPGYQFADEINDQKLVRGVLAMANAGPNTNGSQFFIVTTAATPWLDGRHTVLGKVVKGMDVVDKIGNSETGPNDVPTTAVVVEQIVLK